MKKALMLALAAVVSAAVTVVCLQTAIQSVPTATATATAPVLEELQGTLILLQWEKSYESYCAQGGNYFVINEANHSRILEYSDALRPYADTNVSIRARKVMRTIKCPPDGQCPVPANWTPGQTVPDFECVLFKVMEIAYIDDVPERGSYTAID